MVVAACHPEPKRAKQPPAQRREGRIVRPIFLPKQRIEIIAGFAMTYVSKPLEMIETSAPDVDLLLRHVHDVRHVALGTENTFAQANGAHIAVLAKRQNDTTFRIGKIDQQRIRAQLLDIAREIKYHRQRPQCERQPARSAVLAERLPNPVLLGYFVVELPKSITIDGGRVEHKCCSVECGAAIGRVLD